MNVFYNGSIKARKIISIKNSFMLGEEPNGNYMFEFEDGSQQEVSFEFMDKWSVPKPPLLAGSGLKEGQIIADKDSDGETVETNLILGYFLELEDGRTSYVCQKVYDDWYLNVPDYNGEEIDDFYPEDTDSYKGTNEIYQEVVGLNAKLNHYITSNLDSKLIQLEIQDFIIQNMKLASDNEKATHSNLSLWLEKIERNLDTQLLYAKGQTIMEIVLFVLLLISLFA